MHGHSYSFISFPCYRYYRSLPGVCTEGESWEWFGPLKLAAYSELRASKGMFVERGTKASGRERPLAESKEQ